MSDTAPTSPFDRLWLCEAVRLREEQAGPLEDAEANRRALASAHDLPRRIEARALWLAARDGLDRAQRTWKQGAHLALYLLLLLALLSGAGLALAALGDGQRPVNVFWALASLLGLDLLMLAGWALGFALGGGEAAGALGRLWLWLSSKLARDAQAAHLAPALLVLLGRQRLTRWGLGLLVHGLWLVILSVALVVVLALLSTRRYGFVWETTILGGDTFVALTHALGSLPAWLGFPQPDSELVRASGDSLVASEAARHAWAGWLVGVLVVYGVLPRLLLWGLCLWRWQQGRRGLTLDLNLPGYSLLRERLQPSSERLGVSDAAPDALHEVAIGAGVAAAEGALLVAIELADRPGWPPKLPAGVVDAGVLDDGAQRRRLLEQLTRYPPARLVIACDPRRSADRGTLALIAELARCATATRVWLLQPPPGESQDGERLGDWHAAIERLQLAHTGASPLPWLEAGHD
ncbi:MAG: putative membrane protein [Pseudomonas citronellolis]|nr:MAG: putative membrane protein [Pseudomonas citronellolis]